MTITIKITITTTILIIIIINNNNNNNDNNNRKNDDHGMSFDLLQLNLLWIGLEDLPMLFTGLPWFHPLSIQIIPFVKVLD